jgi:hypothetical protein
MVLQRMRLIGEGLIQSFVPILQLKKVLIVNLTFHSDFYSNYSLHCRRYKSEFLSLPLGHALPLCLLVDARSMASVLKVDLPVSDSEPAWNPEIAPFVVAVHTSGPVTDDQDAPPVQTFNVAIEHLVDEAYPVLIRRDRDPWQMCPDAGPDDLWFARLLTVKIAQG